MTDALAFWIIGAVIALVVGFAGVVAVKIWLKSRRRGR